MIDNPNFSLDLGHPWQPVPNDDPEQYHFRDPGRDVTITLSAMAMTTAPDRLEALAQAVVELRLNAEKDAARVAGRELTFYEPIIAAQSWGQAIAYYGHDDTGRQSNYAGIVTPGSVINLHMTSGCLSEAELMRLMDEVLARMEFDRTPLAQDTVR